MKVKFLQPVKGYAYFEGDVCDIPDKDAKVLIELKKVELVGKTEKSDKDLTEQKKVESTKKTDKK